MNKSKHKRMPYTEKLCFQHKEYICKNSWIEPPQSFLAFTYLLYISPIVISTVRIFFNRVSPIQRQIFYARVLWCVIIHRQVPLS